MIQVPLVEKVGWQFWDQVRKCLKGKGEQCKPTKSTINTWS